MARVVCRTVDDGSDAEPPHPVHGRTDAPTEETATDMPPTATPEPVSDHTEEANALVLGHVDLIGHVLNQVAVRYPRHVDRQELWNAGALGLVDASRRYDGSTGIPFPRYAMIRIRGAIIDSTRTRDWSTRGLRRGMRAVREASERFQVEHGCEPSVTRLAEMLDMTEAQVEAYRTASVASSLLHLDQRVGTGEGEVTTLGELIEEGAPDHLPAERLERRELTGTLRVAIEHLPDVQREVIVRYYFRGEFLRDLADEMGITEARVSQIRSEALTAIRAYFAAQFDTVPQVDERAPGRRRRAAFIANVSTHASWHDRILAADRPLRPLERSA